MSCPRGLRALALAAAAVLGGSGAVLVAAPSSPAAAVSASGWWYRPSTATPTMDSPQPLPGGDPTVPVVAPGPPSVPAGSLHVEGTPEGATAIAAVTFTLAEGESAPVLTLRPDSSSLLPAGAVVLACRAAVPWSPPATAPGRWETKPLVDCSRSVQGQPGPGGELVFPLQALVSGDLLDVVVVPGTVAGLPADADGSTFSLTFPRPDAGALAVSRAEPDSGGGFTPPEPSPDFGSDFSPAEPPAFEGSVEPPLDPVVEPSLEPQDQAPAIPRVAAPPVATPDRGLSGRRAVGLLLMLAATAAAFWATDRTPRTAIGLGRFRRALPAGVAGAGGAGVLETGPPVVRGLGRLRRPRTGEAPAL